MASCGEEHESAMAIAPATRKWSRAASGRRFGPPPALFQRYVRASELSGGEKTSPPFLPSTLGPRSCSSTSSERA